MRSSYIASGDPGCSTAGFKMSPASPPVQHTSTLCTPSAAYLAVVPAPFDASSSGWAWTCSRLSRSSVTRGTLPAAFQGKDLDGADAAHLLTPSGDAANVGAGAVAAARRAAPPGTSTSPGVGELGEPAREVHDRAEVVAVARDHRPGREPDPQRRQPVGRGRVAQRERRRDRLVREPDVHHLVADRLHDPRPVRRDRVVRDRLPAADELRERGGVERRAERRVAREVGEPDRDRRRRVRPRAPCAATPPRAAAAGARSRSARRRRRAACRRGPRARCRRRAIARRRAARASMSAKPAASTDATRASEPLITRTCCSSVPSSRSRSGACDEREARRGDVAVGEHGEHRPARRESRPPATAGGPAPRRCRPRPTSASRSYVRAPGNSMRSNASSGSQPSRLGPVDVVVGRAELDEPRTKFLAHPAILPASLACRRWRRQHRSLARSSRRVLLHRRRGRARSSVRCSSCSPRSPSTSCTPARCCRACASTAPTSAARRTPTRARRIEQLSARTRDDRRSTRTPATETFVVDPSLIGFTVDADATIRAAADAGRRHEPVRAWSTDTVLRRFRPDDVQLVVHYDDAAVRGPARRLGQRGARRARRGRPAVPGHQGRPGRPAAGHGLLRAEAEQRMRALLASGDRPRPRAPDRRRRTRGRPGRGRRRRRPGPGAAHRHVHGGRGHDPGHADARADRADARDPRRRAHARPHDRPRQAALRARPRVRGGRAAAGRRDVRRQQRRTPSPSSRRATATSSTLDAVGAAILRGDRSITATIRNEHPAHDTEVGPGARHHAPGVVVHDDTTPRASRGCTTSTSRPTCSNNTVVEPGPDVLAERQARTAHTPRRDTSRRRSSSRTASARTTAAASASSRRRCSTRCSSAATSTSTTRRTTTTSPATRWAAKRRSCIPYVDLKFRNDTKHGVLIRTSYSATSITVTFYGNTDGRIATEANRKILHTEPITDRLVAVPGQEADRRPEQPAAPSSTAFERDTTVDRRDGIRRRVRPRHHPARQADADASTTACTTRCCRTRCSSATAADATRRPPPRKPKTTTTNAPRRQAQATTPTHRRTVRAEPTVRRLTVRTIVARIRPVGRCRPRRSHRSSATGESG